MTSEIRTNTLTSRAGLSTVTLTDSGPMFSGITTFVDNSTFSVGTGGTIHAPATNTLNIGVNNTESLRIDSNSNLKVAGIVTATHFYGNGSNLTGISAGTSLSGSTNNTVCTVTGANAIQGEANLTFDGNHLTLNTSSSSSRIYLTSGNSDDSSIYFGAQDDTATGAIRYDHSDDTLRLYGYNNTERLRITSGGQIRLPVNGQQLTWGASQQMKFFYENSEDRMYLQGDGAYGFAFRINGGNRLEISKTTGDIIMQGSSGRNFQWDNSEFSLYLTDNGSNSARLKIGTGGDLQLYHDVSGNVNHINAATNGEIKFSANQFSFYDYTGVTRRALLTSNGSVNIGNSSQTTHLLYLQSSGDAGIHIRADSDNSGENDNPYLSMSQDGSNAQLFKLGMVGDAGNEFAQSIANAPFVHANTANVQPLQLAHMNNLAVTISAIESTHFHQTSGTAIGGMKIANRGNDTGAALLLQGHNNTGTPGNPTNTQLTHDGARFEFEIKHGSSRAIHVGSSRRIRLPGIVGVAGSGLQTVYVESDGNLCTTSSLREYKTNITTISDISWLFNLNPVTFNWKKKTEVNGENVWEDTADDNGTQYGLIAEEVEAVKKDFCSYDNNNKLTGVHYDRIITPLIKAVQDLKSEINTLQQENISLRARVTNLEGE